MNEDFEIDEKMIGQNILLAFRGLIPINGKPDFMKIDGVLLKNQKGSIVLGMQEGTRSIEVTIPKNTIQFINWESPITRSVELPINFRS
jgi:hypothetical protein